MQELTAPFYIMKQIFTHNYRIRCP